MLLDKRTNVDITATVLLGVLCVLVSVFIIKMDAAGVVPDSKFDEDSLTEKAQLIYLGLSSLMFIGAFVRSKDRRGFSTLMAGGVLVLMVREMDGVFDRVFYHGAWLPIAFCIACVSAIMAFRYRNRLIDNICEFIMSPIFGTFLAACLSIFVFSRMFGMKGLWESFFNVEQLAPMQRWVKNAVEEGSELFGYTILFLSSFGFFHFASRVKTLSIRWKNAPEKFMDEAGLTELEVPAS